MAFSGRTAIPSSRYCFSHHSILAFRVSWKSREKLNLFYQKRTFSAGCKQQSNVKQSNLIRPVINAVCGDSADESTAIFPRLKIKDPYKRLGISKDASEEEIQGARNFLIQKYSAHKASVDAIESAHDKILMQKFYERKNPKINIKKKVREVRESLIVQRIASRFQTPSTKFVIKTSFLFTALGLLTVFFPTEEGPTLQVAISLMATLYFIYDRLKNKIRALLYGVGSFMVSWLVGTFLMVSVIPPFVKGPRSLEVTTSLLSYILLWCSSTYLK